ncbi:hypothetical protein AGOR_G00119690 [Albula goreensis]|uniref:Ig-like domain-containing protein n=1 Tax=Albula goreensis TaxID=1534307 RepID=A0A8T3DFB6_9TELE|nr:hypothetical protein AGOR_G00119690 [Albula goreensis]
MHMNLVVIESFERGTTVVYVRSFTKETLQLSKPSQQPQDPSVLVNAQYGSQGFLWETTCSLQCHSSPGSMGHSGGLVDNQVPSACLHCDWLLCGHPCSFTPPPPGQEVDVKWYQYVNRGYPLVYSRTDPDNVISKFKGKTELFGSDRDGDCSLKINATQMSQNAERLYPWIEPNKLSGNFYDNPVTLNITAQALTPEIQVEAELTEGHTARLSCSTVHSCPPYPPSISFTGLREPLERQEIKSQWKFTTAITWQTSSEDHGKNVTCTVTHPGGQTASAKIVLNVTYPPKSVHVEGNGSVVPPGGNVLLSCKSEANPPASSFRWYRTVAGQPVPLTQTTSETLIVTARDLDPDQNKLHCEAINSHGEAKSPNFDVNVEYGPTIRNDSHCSYDGGAVSCLCQARARPQASVQWRVDGEDQRAGPTLADSPEDNTVRGTWTANGTTERINVTCIVKNRHGQDELLLRMHVKAPPTKVSLTQHPPHPTEGEGVTLSCLSWGYPPVSRYRWYRGPAGLEARLQEESRDLHVKNATRTSDPYRCSAHNEKGESSSASTWLNVEYAPVILPDSSCTLSNSQYRCECVVDSNPVAEVTWSSARSLTNEKHSMSSVVSGRVLTAVLVFTEPTEDRARHHVICNATNRYGAASHRLPFAEKGGSQKKVLVLGVTGGGVALLIILGVCACCARKRRPHTHLSQKRTTELALEGTKPTKGAQQQSGHLYENTDPRPHPPAVSESIYEVEDAQRYGDYRSQGTSEDVYANY